VCLDLIFSVLWERTLEGISSVENLLCLVNKRDSARLDMALLLGLGKTGTARPRSTDESTDDNITAFLDGSGLFVKFLSLRPRPRSEETEHSCRYRSPLGHDLISRPRVSGRPLPRDPVTVPHLSTWRSPNEFFAPMLATPL
jgi:hypothetical protein